MEPEEGTPLWQLQKLPAERGPQLLHKIIDGICGRAYPVYQDYHSVWESEEWIHVLEDVTKFFKAVVGKNLSDEEILQQLNQLNSSHQETIMKCVKSRKDEIKQALLREIVAISSAQLQDFDWQVKVRIYL
nr:COMM domain-containing protein 8 isoform X1 [Aotus nancymaae]